MGKRTTSDATEDAVVKILLNGLRAQRDAIKTSLCRTKWKIDLTPERIELLTGTGRVSYDAEAQTIQYVRLLPGVTNRASLVRVLCGERKLSGISSDDVWDAYTDVLEDIGRMVAVKLVFKLYSGSTKRKKITTWCLFPTEKLLNCYTQGVSKIDAVSRKADDVCLRFHEIASRVRVTSSSPAESSLERRVRTKRVKNQDETKRREDESSLLRKTTLDLGEYSYLQSDETYAFLFPRKDAPPAVVS